MKKYAILGGTFDPPHFGHIEIASRALSQFEIEEVVFIPAGNPWHKDEKVSNYEKRLNMVKILVSGINNMSVSDIENDTINPTYTIDTLKALNEIGKQSKSIKKHYDYLILGADIALTFSTWKDFESIFDYSEILIAPRDGVDNSEIKEIFPGPYKIIKGKDVDLTSTYIRNNIDSPLVRNEFLPEEIYKYIVKNELYIN
jgi:nicotinate-nucleotide adenylyltransferase|tara:strand:- start:27 stop:626 length:600 start_codon:yes stop_codon:yes gene_type:complete